MAAPNKTQYREIGKNQRGTTRRIRQTG